MPKNKIMRIGSMVPGMHCAVIVNNSSKNYMVHSNSSDRPYITVAGRRCFEEDIPMGEEVLIWVKIFLELKSPMGLKIVQHAKTVFLTMTSIVF